MTIRPYQGKLPEIAKSAYIDPAAIIIGDVKIGEESSIWPLTVVRGDVHYIRIGARTNVQDGSVLHVMRDEYPLVLGDDVTVESTVTFGRSSFEVEHKLSLNGETCVECSEKRVWVVRDANGKLKPHPVPQAVLNKFRK